MSILNYHCFQVDRKKIDSSKMILKRIQIRVSFDPNVFQVMFSYFVVKVFPIRKTYPYSFYVVPYI